MNRTIDFLGIGAARSGTSWLSNVLRAHPDICLSEPKEIRYFNQNRVPIGANKGKLNSNFERDFEWYLKHFAHAKDGQLKGEVSPVYLLDKSAPQAIHERCPNVKLIVCLRNPVDRAYSSYKLHRGLGEIADISFEEALQREPVYFDMSMYAHQLKRYLARFNSENFHIIIFEQLIQSPQVVFKRLFEFLGVAPFEQDYSEYHTNEASNQRSTALYRIAFGLNDWLIASGMSSVVKRLRDIGAHNFFNRVNSAPANFPKLAPETRAMFSRRVRDDVEKVEALFDLDLNCWK